MLKKLLKYDLKNIFKLLIIFYSLALFFGTLTRLFFSIENSLIMDIIAKICSGTTIAMMFNILINNMMRLWVTFKNNLYGDESYLTHTLPIEKKTLYLSKILTAVITLFTSVIVIGLTLFVAYYSKDNLELVKSMLLPLANIYGSTVMNILFSFLFVFFLEFANVLQAGFSGIILGHKMNNLKTLYSVLYGFVVYTFIQIFTLILMFVVALFNKDMMNLFYTTEIINVDMVKLIIYLAIIIYTVTLVVLYLVNIKLFSKGVNVD